MLKAVTSEFWRKGFRTLNFSQNAVDVLAKDAPFGTPLFVWDTDQQTQSMMTMSGNRLRNKLAMFSKDIQSCHLEAVRPPHMSYIRFFQLL